ncbi:MAG: PAS domain-containing sensor histidine kinase [Candidatus Methanofastidiosa archaeon]|nr:PAS domain-containing sensor histidine kinase [Candidatus Methanofastidiosa archaeon]
MGQRIRITVVTEHGRPSPLFSRAAGRAHTWEVTCMHPDVPELSLDGDVAYADTPRGLERIRSEYRAPDATHPCVLVTDDEGGEAPPWCHLLPRQDATPDVVYHLITSLHTTFTHHLPTEQAWTLLDTIRTQVWSFDLATRIYVHMNAARRAFLGITGPGPVPMDQALAQDDATCCLASYARALEAGAPVSSKQWMRNADGEERLLYIRKYPLHPHRRDSSLLVCTADDITDRERILQELEESHERYRSLVEHMPVAVWEEDYSATKAALMRLIAEEGITDIEAYLSTHPDVVRMLVGTVRIISLNRAGLRMYGASTFAECVSSLATVFSSSSYEMFARALCAMARGEAQVTGEDVNYTLSGRRMDVLVTWTVVPGHEDTYDFVLVSNLDITDRAMTERLLASQKEELSAFAHTLAHDMRGPLSSIRGYAELAHEDIGPSRPLERIIERVDELDSLVTVTLSSALAGMSSRRGRCDTATDIIASIVRDMVPPDIDVEVGKIPLLPMDETTCRQVFFNLIHNAVVHAHPTTVSIHYERTALGHVVRVCDNGKGIDPSLFDIIFERGYTTHPEGHGVGLPIIRHLIEGCGGTIQARSSSQGGACFVMTFPAVE